MSRLENKRLKIYIDFDGTITIKDIGEHMFLKFGDPEEAKNIIDRWLNGRLNSKEVWIKLCETVKNLDKKEFDDFLNETEIDPYFKDFIAYTKKHKIDVTILSDGLDYYIDKISKKENFDDIPLYCNKLEIDNNGKLIPYFPYTDEECDKCANCKRNHLINSSSDEDLTIYIGDGWSDTCVAEHSDIIFAKKSLLKYCEQNGLPYYPFKNFRDVQKIIEQIRTKKKVKKRHRAEIKRKDAYSQG